MFSCQLMNLQYSSLVAQVSPSFSLSSKRVNFFGWMLSNRGSWGSDFGWENMASLLELWVCAPTWVMLSIDHA